jgi:hypothetical protein
MELLYKKAVKAHANVGSSTVLFNFIENKLHSRGYGTDNDVPWRTKAFYRWKMGRRDKTLLQKMYPNFNLLDGDQASPELQCLIDSQLYVGKSGLPQLIDDKSRTTDAVDTGSASPPELPTQLANESATDAKKGETFQEEAVEFSEEGDHGDCVGTGVEVQISLDGTTAPMSTTLDNS